LPLKVEIAAKCDCNEPVHLSGMCRGLDLFGR
jgi:hypothetical protein